MELMTILPAILTSFGAIIATFAVFKSARSLKSRLRIEKKLANNLALELRAMNIESEINVHLNKITVMSEAEGKEITALKSQIDIALHNAVRTLVEDERKLVLKTLKQPSKQGQMHYTNKIISNSVQELSHQKA